MSTASLIVLVIVFFLTSLIGIVTGSNSLIAVPVMFQVGIEPRTAVATNMFALVFMAVGGTIPFIRQRRIDYRRVTPLILLTVVSSAIGAMLVGLISGAGIKVIVSVAMIAVSLFVLLKPSKQGGSESTQTRNAIVVMYVLTFLLGIYGGLFSGGYVTILTAACVGIARMSYGEAVASTKLINVFSSAVATIVFMWQGLVDYRLGSILGVTMFAGGYAGAHLATRMSEVWLRRIFLATVLVLAAKTIYDLL